MAKGAQFERDFCSQLSLWWSDGERDDLFWRTAGSGGRATNRSRKGKNTTNSYGDILALDPKGQPLLDVFTFELKRGYNRHTLQDLLDKPERGAKQVYEQWFEQAKTSQQGSKSKSWCIVVKRDRREPIVIMPVRMATALSIEPLIEISVYILPWKVVALPLVQWFEQVIPKKIKEYKYSFQRI